MALVYPSDGGVAAATHLIRNDNISVLVRTVPVSVDSMGLAGLQARSEEAAAQLIDELAGSAESDLAA